MDWLKQKIKRWLGIDRNEARLIYLTGKYNILDSRTSNIFKMGVDVHFKSPHMLLVFSRVNGGQIRHIDIDVQDFRELRKMVDELKERYGIKEKPYWDVPPQLRQTFK